MLNYLRLLSFRQCQCITLVMLIEESKKCSYTVEMKTLFPHSPLLRVGTLTSPFPQSWVRSSTKVDVFTQHDPTQGKISGPAVV